MAKKSVPIPDDLLKMSISQLQAEAASYDGGDLRIAVNRLVEQRDEAQAELSRHSVRRNDINRALIEKYSENISGCRREQGR